MKFILIKNNKGRKIPGPKNMVDETLAGYLNDFTAVASSSFTSNTV
jgi:hypothetical protein